VFHWPLQRSLLPGEDDRESDPGAASASLYADRVVAERDEPVELGLVLRARKPMSCDPRADLVVDEDRQVPLVARKGNVRRPRPARDLRVEAALVLGAPV
jgi:hypothetical protein